VGLFATADRLVVGVPDAECITAPGRQHAISTRPPVPAFSQAAIARFKGSMFLAITVFDMRTFAPIAMSAFSAMSLAAVSTLAMSMLVSSATGE
jgi:hypothetical protein